MFGKKSVSVDRLSEKTLPSPTDNAAPVAISPPPVAATSGAVSAAVAKAVVVQPAVAAPAKDTAMMSVAAAKAEALKNVQVVSFTDPKLVTPDFTLAKQMLVEELLEQVNFEALEKLPKDTRKARISEFIDTLLSGMRVPLTSPQTALLKADLINEVLGFGPIEVLMADPDVSDIMINGHKQVYIEKAGKILLSDIKFTSERHLLDMVQKIVSLVGRRVDEVSPMVDARMADGSRFNAIIPPLALDGSLVSIRKFKKSKMPLSQYVAIESMSADMCKFLEICGHIRLNIIISGGTGSGKTTLLNALSGHIDLGERVITIEDAAELSLHQPHVLRLETRPSNMEGKGEINQRQLMKNALRMRPDRIILGEIRGEEALDLLSAMNTGHDGSMATIHSNSPRDCLSRMENLLSMTGFQMPLIAMRQQIASAVDLIVQIARMRDGRRRVTQIEEVIGMEGDIIISQPIFTFQPGPQDANGFLTGKFSPSGIRPRFLTQAQYFGRDKEMIECLHLNAESFH